MSAHILIVDDEDIICRAVGRMLAIEGFVPLAFTSPRAALELLGGHTRVDLLIADIVMPEFRGPMLAGLAQELRPGLPVLLISGYPAVVGADTVALQAHAFLSKPFSGDDLVRAVRRLLDAETVG